jgi:folylpolyglutamate synthase/dihydropteroate synthase
MVHTADDPREALSRAHTLGPRVLVTGSLYLLADLYSLAETGRSE